MSIVAPKLRKKTRGGGSGLQKQTIGYYPSHAARTPPPEFGPKCVPPSVGRQIDAHLASMSKDKDKDKSPKIVEVTREVPSEPKVDVSKFSLCVPQSPSRFSSTNVSEQSNPRPSILQNPQRIVADGPFAVNEAVKSNYIPMDIDGLQPLRLKKQVTSTETRKTLRDLQLLVQASLRTKNIKDEASAYFNIGLLYESEGQLRKANSYYTKYLQALGADADPLVFNRIAVNFHLLREFDDAIEWNLRHLSFSRSLFETIAANCNLALIYRDIGDNIRSVEFYRSALETAEEMEESEDSPFYDQITKLRNALQNQIELAEGESKVTYIGAQQLSAHSFGDRLERTDINRRQIDTQEEFLQSQSRISLEQGDLTTAYESNISAGKLNCVFGDFDRSEQYYLQALEIARKIGSSEFVYHAKIALGIVRGNRDLKKFGLFDENGVPDPSLFAV